MRDKQFGDIPIRWRRANRSENACRRRPPAAALQLWVFAGRAGRRTALRLSSLESCDPRGTRHRAGGTSRESVLPRDANPLAATGHPARIRRAPASNGRFLSLEVPAPLLTARAERMSQCQKETER